MMAGAAEVQSLLHVEDDGGPGPGRWSAEGESLRPSVDYDRLDIEVPFGLIRRYPLSSPFRSGSSFIAAWKTKAMKSAIAAA